MNVSSIAQNPYISSLQHQSSVQNQSVSSSSQSNKVSLTDTATFSKTAQSLSQNPYSAESTEVSENDNDGDDVQKSASQSKNLASDITNLSQSRLMQDVLAAYGVQHTKQLV